MEIKGQAAIVTGGGSGLGAATARALAAAGARVAVVDINEKAAADLDRRKLRQEPAACKKMVDRNFVVFRGIENDKLAGFDIRCSHAVAYLAGVEPPEVDQPLQSLLHRCEVVETSKWAPRAGYPGSEMSRRTKQTRVHDAEPILCMSEVAGKRNGPKPQLASRPESAERVEAKSIALVRPRLRRTSRSRNAAAVA